MEDLRRIAWWHGPVYAGSFDPVTRGHLDIIKRTVTLFGSCLVLIADNPDKKGMFDPAERKRLVDASLEEAGIGNGHLTPSAVTDGYVADLCQACRATFLVRGIRDASELPYEAEIARFNRNRTGIDTVFLPADPELSRVSSSNLKSSMAYIGICPIDPSKFATACVVEAVRIRLKEQGVRS